MTRLVMLSVVALVVAAAAASPSTPPLQINLQPNGQFDISLNGSAWLSGGETQVAGYSSSAGSLVTVGSPKQSSGKDVLGAYEATTLTWAAKGSSATLMETTFKTYPDDHGMIVFEQSFPSTLKTPPTKQPVRDSTDACRVVTEPFSLTSSQQGYTAYTPSKSGSGFDAHPGNYCDDNHHWAYLSDSVSQQQCADKCASLKCTCFDYRAGGPSPALSAKTIFPGFSRDSGPSGGLPVFSYHGVFPQIEGATLATYSDSHQGGAPLVIYDPTDDALPMTVFSPLNYPKAHHMASSDKFVGAGVKATVDTIPAGWVQSFILSSGAGINDGMMAWGDRMLTFTGKKRADMYLDTTHSTIGFWTDNGGFYHYSIGNNKSLGSNYEEVLPKVKAYHDSIGVPFGHWQFDSWFYPKDGGVNPGGGGGAVTNWTAMPSVFPHGMAYIQSKLKVPMVMHNRQWSDKSDYIKNEPFKWYESKYAVPEDPVAFFTWFFKQQQDWGLAMYEQDWMCTEYDGVDALQKNISMGDLWLYGMATGAASSNRTVQYCMPYPNDVLSASAYPAVTNARATGDYFHANNQWAVGGTALFYWAIGILPFKDGFYSSTNKQVGGQTVGPETNPDREAIMATLSCAMVGPMDGIYLLNASRVFHTCRKDGLVLKPDRPVTTTDACFRKSNPTCQVYHTYSDLKGAGSRVHYLFNNDNEPITPDMVYASPSDDYVVYNWYSGAATKLQASTTVEPGYEGHIYAVVSPVAGQWAFIGEPNKYVTASNTRFGTVKSAGNKLTVDVVGVAKEVVSVCAAQVANQVVVQCQDVQFSAAGTKTAVFTA